MQKNIGFLRGMAAIARSRPNGIPGRPISHNVSIRREYKIDLSRCRFALVILLNK